MTCRFCLRKALHEIRDIHLCRVHYIEAIEHGADFVLDVRAALIESAKCGPKMDGFHYIGGHYRRIPRERKRGIRQDIGNGTDGQHLQGRDGDGGADVLLHGESVARLNGESEQ